MHAYVLQRAPQRWFDVVVWPVVDAILFGAIGVYFGRHQGGGSGAEAGAAFLLAGIVLFHVVFQAEISLATGFMEETWSRNLLNLMVTPLREVEYATGVVLFGLAKLVIGVGTVAIVAFALFAFDITSLGLALIPMVALLLVVGLGRRPARDRPDPARRAGRRDPRVGLRSRCCCRCRGSSTRSSALPDALQPIAQALPTTHIFAAARSGRRGSRRSRGNSSVSPPPSTVVLCVLSVWFVSGCSTSSGAAGYISRHV